MSDLIVEQATPGDLSRLGALLTTCLGDGFSSRLGPKEGLRRLLEDPSLGRIAVVRQDGPDGQEGRIIAMAALIPTISTAQGGFVLWVEEMLVDPAHLNDGCEALLLNYAADHARENGFSRITLLPSTDTPHTERYLGTHGYEASGMIPLRRATFL